jgi:2'-5' RNA ligase
MSWRDAYRHGTLLLLPPPTLGRAVDALRERHDPPSHRICRAHITLTQPLLAPLEPAGADAVRAVLADQAPFEVRYGPVERLGPRVVVLRIEPRETLLGLRERLHALDLFDLTLPFTEGFVPHMTISERGVDAPLEALEGLSGPLPTGSFPCTAVHQLIPDDDFVFELARTFPLGGPRPA